MPKKIPPKKTVSKSKREPTPKKRAPKAKKPTLVAAKALAPDLKIMAKSTVLKFVHFCEHASMTTDGKLNLNGIFESIFATEVPTKHSSLYILARLSFPLGQHQMTFALMQEDRILAKMVFDKTVTRAVEDQNHLWNLHDLPLSSWAPLVLNVFDNNNWIGHAELPLYHLKTGA